MQDRGRILDTNPWSLCFTTYPCFTSRSSASTRAHEAAPLRLRVEAAAVVARPGQAGGKTWRRWFPIASLTAPHDTNFHKTVQLNMQAWIVEEGLDDERCAAVVVSGEGLSCMLLLTLPRGEERPATCQLMAALDFAPELLGRLVEELGRQQLAPPPAPARLGHNRHQRRRCAPARGGSGTCSARGANSAPAAGARGATG